MNSKKTRRTRVLICNECGQKFRPEGKELRCAACMAADGDRFLEWLGSQPIELQREMLAALRQTARELGCEIDDPYGVDRIEVEEEEAEVVNPEEIAHPNQARIDAAFYDLMEGFEL